MKNRQESERRKGPRSRRDLEREIWVTAHGGRRAFQERFEALITPMAQRMESGAQPEPDDLDRFLSLMLFFDAAALVCANTPKKLSELPDKGIKEVAMCLGLDPNWSTGAGGNADHLERKSEGWL